MEAPMSRRRALAVLGGVSLGTLLAACSGDGGEATTTAEVETSSGDTTTVQPSTGASTERAGSAASLLDDTSSCTLAAEQTEGPFYFDADSIRSDIREDREGVTLTLAVRVRRAESCEPLRNAVVDIWHCDAGGSYSDGGERFLRGAQVTNADGLVEFTTVYPGVYPGRTAHVHAKVHLDSTTVLTTQLYFDDAVTNEVQRREPYAGETSSNAGDGIFDESLLLRLAEDGDGGWLGAISLDVAA